MRTSGEEGRVVVILLKLQDTHLRDEVAQVSGRNETAERMDRMDEVLSLEVSRGDEMLTKVLLFEESPHEDIIIRSFHRSQAAILKDLFNRFIPSAQHNKLVEMLKCCQYFKLILK